ncbi:hypothetical protein GOBAR_AA31716 [Gossypium barbadense]|uniref:Uncharacterized protein n=1 Tax=Gossypium barbadense TaxID=3634 RepID=A0A2P5WD16_GOSBA|nr:hypothetical protein GOBAR_AA31716 [Gossypium barbadense]
MPTFYGAPQHRGPRIILDPHWPYVFTRHLEHAKHEDDRKAPRNLVTTPPHQASLQPSKDLMIDASSQFIEVEI